jgi:hypothetical protein
MKMDLSHKSYSASEEQVLNSSGNRLFLILDLSIVALTIIGVSIFKNQADLVLIMFWFIVGIYVFLTRRYISFLHFIISTSIAFLWVYCARNNYGYNYSYFSVAGMNLLPVAAWSMGLLSVSEILNHFGIERMRVRILFFTLLFWCALIFIETYAFHVIGIRNISTGNSNGLPFCNCIHAPWWMRIVYFSMGPAYYLITIIADQVMQKSRNNNGLSDSDNYREQIIPLS